MSKLPWVATMVIFFVSSSASRDATVSSSSSMRACSCASLIASPSPVEGVSVLMLGRLLDVVFVDVAVFDLFEQFDAVGPLGPAVDVAHAPAVGREHFEDAALREVVDCTLGLYYGHRARFTFHVERLCDVECFTHCWKDSSFCIGATAQYCPHH